MTTDLLFFNPFECQRLYFLFYVTKRWLFAIFGLKGKGLTLRKGIYPTI